MLPQLLESVDRALIPVVVAGRAQFFGLRGMTRQLDPAHAHAARSQPLAEVAHLVGSPAQAVNQQSADPRARKEKFVGIDARCVARWRLVGIGFHFLVMPLRAARSFRLTIRPRVDRCRFGSLPGPSANRGIASMPARAAAGRILRGTPSARSSSRRRSARRAKSPRTGTNCRRSPSRDRSLRESPARPRRRRSPREIRRSRELCDRRAQTARHF